MGESFSCQDLGRSCDIDEARHRLESIIPSQFGRAASRCASRSQESEGEDQADFGNRLEPVAEDGTEEVPLKWEVSSSSLLS